MSFSSTFYRISESLFLKIENRLIKPQQLVNESKSFVTIQDSSDAILFILKKRATNNIDQLINEIFFPAASIGAVSDEEFQKLVESNNYQEIDRINASTFYFLPPEKVIALNTFLEPIDSLEIRRLYNSDELNKKGIYPGLWAPGEDLDKAYNLSHLQIDLGSIKRLFADASAEMDYIITFSG